MSRRRDSEEKTAHLNKSASRETQMDRSDIENQDTKSEQDYQVDESNPVSKDMEASREQAIKHNGLHTNK